MNVFSYAISKPLKSAEQFKEDCHIDHNSDIDYFLIHHANKMIVDGVVKKLELPLVKVLYNLEEFGVQVPSLMVTRIIDKLRIEETT